MPPVELLLPFLVASWVLMLAPGPDILGTLSFGIAGGRAAGVGFASGVMLGCVGHLALAVGGVSAVIASSDAAFHALLYVGAAYLIYIGMRSLRSGGSFHGLHRTDQPTIRRFWRAVRRGFFTNALNPKAALFFMAFLPQFVDPSRPVAGQLAVLGAIFWPMATVLYTLLGFFAGRVGEWLAQRPGVGRRLDQITGVIFLLLGLHLFVSGLVL